MRMPPGSLLIMNLNSRHALETADPSAAVINLCLQPGLFEAGVFADFLTSGSLLANFLRGRTGKDHLLFSDTPDGALRRAVADMLSEYAASGLKPSFSLAAQVLLLLDRLAKLPAGGYVGIDPTALEMVSWLQEHCAEPGGMADLARAFGYSRAYCSRFIRRHTGKNPSEFVAEARIARADDLLASSDLSVEAVARAVGYRSVGHFNELFRARRGMTPGDYRRLRRALPLLS